MKLISMGAVVVAMLLMGCNKLNEDDLTDEDRVKIARNAVKIIGGETEWACTGKKPKSKDEFITVTLQRNPKNNKFVLMASEITLEGRGYSQKGILLQPVTALISNQDVDLEMYYLPGVDHQNPANSPFATYNKRQQTVFVGKAWHFWDSIKMDCRENKYELTPATND